MKGLRRESEILAAAGSPDRTELWIVPGTNHVGARRVNPAAYDGRVIDFSRRTLADGEDVVSSGI